MMTRIGRSIVGLGAGLAMALVALATTFGAAEAQESWLIGTWEGTAETTSMPGPSIAMTWTAETDDDGALTGSWTGAAEGQSFTGDMFDISVDGDAFGFTVRIDDQGQVGVFVFQGTMEEDEVTGTFEVSPEGMPVMLTGTFSGARAEGDGP